MDEVTFDFGGIVYLSDGTYEPDVDPEVDDAVRHSIPHADQVVDERAVISVSITYPLTRSTVMTVASKVGRFTRQGLVNAFVKAYEDIYDAEAAVTTDPDDKPYGIWGHDLDDLILEGLHRDEQGIWHPEVAS
jgi:hypothetical protein